MTNTPLWIYQFFLTWINFIHLFIESPLSVVFYPIPKCFLPTNFKYNLVLRYYIAILGFALLTNIFIKKLCSLKTFLVTKDTLKVSFIVAKKKKKKKKKKSYCKTINTIDNESLKITPAARLFVQYLKGYCLSFSNCLDFCILISLYYDPPPTLEYF